LRSFCKKSDLKNVGEINPSTENLLYQIEVKHDKLRNYVLEVRKIVSKLKTPSKNSDRGRH
jgi:hypothetical protein